MRDKPEVSYTELEFDTATEAGLDRLVFLLDESAADVGIPLSALLDREFGTRQDAFRRRIQDSGLVTGSFASPAALAQLVERSLRELAKTRGLGGSQGGPHPAIVVVGEIPQEPLGFQSRADLLAALDTPGPGAQVRVVSAVTGMRGVGKTHLAAAYARAKLAEGWRLVAWVNAEDPGGMLADLAEVATALGLDAGAGDGQTAGRVVRHWLEADGELCLLVFDNAEDPELLRPFIPAAGAARVIIASNRLSVSSLGARVPVDVFSEPEALTFLAVRTGQADTAGARELAAAVEFLPLALAQAAAVIAAQHLPYATYLERLRRLPVSDLLVAEEAGDYPRGVAASVLLSLDAVRAGPDGQACAAVMDLVAVLSAAGVPRSLVQLAAGEGLAGRDGPVPALAAEVTDRVLGRLAGTSLLTFGVDGSAVTAHRLVMRVIRENLAASDGLTAVCEAAARLLAAQVRQRSQSWHRDRAATRDLVEQILALDESAAGCPPGSGLDREIIGLRRWALVYLGLLGDSAARAVAIGERLVVDQERVLGPDHPDTLSSRGILALAYRSADRTGEAITLYEQVLADRERVLGPDHPDTLSSRASLADAYQAADRTGEAITLYEQVLADIERVLDPDDPNTLNWRASLGLAYLQVGRGDEAITLLEQVLADIERVLGSDHPLTLISRRGLALAYEAAGRTGEAITLRE